MCCTFRFKNKRLRQLTFLAFKSVGTFSSSNVPTNHLLILNHLSRTVTEFPPYTLVHHNNESLCCYKMFPRAQTSSPNLKLIDPFLSAPRHHLPKITMHKLMAPLPSFSQSIGFILCTHSFDFSRRIKTHVSTSNCQISDVLSLLPLTPRHTLKKDVFSDLVAMLSA